MSFEKQTPNVLFSDIDQSTRVILRLSGVAKGVELDKDNSDALYTALRKKHGELTTQPNITLDQNNIFVDTIAPNTTDHFAALRTVVEEVDTALMDSLVHVAISEARFAPSDIFPQTLDAWRLVSSDKSSEVTPTAQQLFDEHRTKAFSALADQALYWD